MDSYMGNPWLAARLQSNDWRTVVSIKIDRGRYCTLVDHLWRETLQWIPVGSRDSLQRSGREDFITRVMIMGSSSSSLIAYLGYVSVDKCHNIMERTRVTHTEILVAPARRYNELMLTVRMVTVNQSDICTYDDNDVLCYYSLWSVLSMPCCGG